MSRIVEWKPKPAAWWEPGLQMLPGPLCVSSLSLLAPLPPPPGQIVEVANYFHSLYLIIRSGEGLAPRSPIQPWKEDSLHLLGAEPSSRPSSYGGDWRTLVAREQGHSI